MKAYVVQPKSGIDGLTLIDRATPALGPTDVRVRVHAVSLNYRDLIIARGVTNLAKPIVPVSDGAGEVVDVGSAVTRWKKGDRVVASFFPTWQSGLLSDAHHAAALGGGQDGMLAEEVVLPESAWLAVPEHLSFDEAATLPCAGVTAHNALFESASLRPGDTVLVQGTGGVSIFALQLAKAAGATVVLTSQSAEKRERGKQLGADHVIDYKADPTWGESAFAWTGGRGVDIAVEVGGPGTFNQSVASLRYGGTVSLIGVLTGMGGEINTSAIFRKALRVAGIYVGSVDMFETFNRALSASRIKPIIDRVYAFDQAKQAYEHLASAKHFGKVVIRTI
ncbi:NAD(P)-dependent alcohol dehydrogenase [Pendulispora albinea]|uniref:NAD(P)-dependent alcohol dehydrogenase n=1 Tax=Pendulispora albinea TaxID=2741071 RepID=A0ABZ2LQV4_9BACT